MIGLIKAYREFTSKYCLYNRKTQNNLNRLLKYTLPVFGLVLLIALTLRGNIIHQKFDTEKWGNWMESETELSTHLDMMNALRTNYQLKS